MFKQNKRLNKTFILTKTDSELKKQSLNSETW